MTSNEQEELEVECENSVYDVSYYRQFYPVRCANYLEKELKCKTILSTLPISKSVVPEFAVPTLNGGQEELFNNFNKHSQKGTEVKSKVILNRIKELKHILHHIEKKSNV